MKDINIIELYKMKMRLIREGLHDDELMHDILNAIKYKETKIIEDTSASGGPVVSGGMGAVVSAQPSGLAGTTIGTNWASGGGTVGSGDVSIPYNPSGSNRVFQNIPGTRKSREHGGKKGKKLRKDKIDLKALKQTFSKRQDYTNNQEEKGKRVLDFNDFLKNDFNTIKK
jgi:hypothetical protein